MFTVQEFVVCNKTDRMSLKKINPAIRDKRNSSIPTVEFFNYTDDRLE